MASEDKKFHKPGPKPERVKIDENWEDAVKRALEKERPTEGWPEDDDDAHSDPDSEPEKGK